MPLHWQTLAAARLKASLELQLVAEHLETLPEVAAELALASTSKPHVTLPPGRQVITRMAAHFEAVAAEITGERRRAEILADELLGMDSDAARHRAEFMPLGAADVLLVERLVFRAWDHWATGSPEMRRAAHLALVLRTRLGLFGGIHPETLRDLEIQTKATAAWHARAAGQPGEVDRLMRHLTQPRVVRSGPARAEALAFCAAVWLDSRELEAAERVSREALLVSVDEPQARGVLRALLVNARVSRFKGNLDGALETLAEFGFMPELGKPGAFRAAALGVEIAAQVGEPTLTFLLSRQLVARLPEASPALRAHAEVALALAALAVGEKEERQAGLERLHAMAGGPESAPVAAARALVILAELAAIGGEEGGVVHWLHRAYSILQESRIAAFVSPALQELLVAVAAVPLAQVPLLASLRTYLEDVEETPARPFFHPWPGSWSLPQEPLETTGSVS